MDPEVAKIQIDGLVQITKWISFLIVSGAALAGCVCVLRLIKQTDFMIGQLKLSLSQFPYVVMAFTAAHSFLLWILTQRVTAMHGAGAQIAQRAWLAVTSSDALVFFNMRPRVWKPHGSPFGTGAFVAQNTDTAYWATFGFAIITIAAIVAARLPSESLSNRPRRIFSIFSLGCVLASANWIIGSRWAIALSSLLL